MNRVYSTKLKLLHKTVVIFTVPCRRTSLSLKHKTFSRGNCSSPQRMLMNFRQLSNREFSSYPLLQETSSTERLELTADVVNKIISSVYQDIPRSLPLIGLLKNTQDSRVLCKLHTDSWPHFSSIVCEIFYPRVSEVADLLLYTRGDLDNLLHLLQSKSVLSWGKKQQIYHTESCVSEHLQANIKDPVTGYNALSPSLRAVQAYSPSPTTSKAKKIDFPDGYRLGSLLPCHASLVSKYWTKFNNWPKNLSFIEGLISDFDTKAVYLEGNLETPVAWVLQYPFGRMGGLYTMREHRNMDFGTILTTELSKTIAAGGLVPETLTEVGNKISRKITANAGLVESDYELYWLVLES